MTLKYNLFSPPLLSSLTSSSPFQIYMSASFLATPGVEVSKLEFILRLKIKHNDWLFADTCPQAANHWALF